MNKTMGPWLVAVAERWPRSRSAQGPRPRLSGRRLTKVTVQLKWVTQAQFAGYYAAQKRATTRRPGST